MQKKTILFALAAVGMLIGGVAVTTAATNLTNGSILSGTPAASGCVEDDAETDDASEAAETENEVDDGPDVEEENECEDGTDDGPKVPRRRTTRSRLTPRGASLLPPIHGAPPRSTLVASFW